LTNWCWYASRRDKDCLK